ncbi:MAG: anti-sigma factor family protein, partial [Candidatus Limnocylindria bacterium]
MSHVTDDLELYALGALPAMRQAEVREHLAACAACRTEAEPLLALVETLPEALTPRDPPPALRDRVLASARGGVARA